MALFEEFEEVLNRVEKGQQTADDISILRQSLQSGDRQVGNTAWQI